MRSLTTTLLQIQQKYKSELKLFLEKEKLLEKEWLKLQKRCCKTDEFINKLKKKEKSINGEQIY
jgi:hypothetical protein